MFRVRRNSKPEREKMERMSTTRRVSLSFLAIAALVSGDTLIFRNGSRVEGTFIGGDNRSIRFAAGNQVNTYNLNDVESIRFSSAPAPPPAAPANYPPPQNDSSAQNYPPSQNYPPPQNRPPDTYAGSPGQATNNAPSGLEVPAGTQIVVRLIDPVNSETDRLGQSYRASIDQPVIVDGQTAIPRGADVVATLIDAQKSGKIEGRTVLTLDLRSVTVNGRSYDIVTSGVPQSSGSRGERSAKVIGGTAALGAIIGGIAGGGKGAAIGAGSGAAVGTAAEVSTSGQKVKVPAETRLTFTLQNPIELR
jgi:hypothetical protein